MNLRNIKRRSHCIIYWLPRQLFDLTTLVPKFALISKVLMSYITTFLNHDLENFNFAKECFSRLSEKRNKFPLYLTQPWETLLW